MKELKPIVFEEMTIEQKIGFIMCGGSWKPLVDDPEELEYHLDLIRKRALGSIWISNNLKVAGSFQQTIDKVLEAADYPIIIMGDAESGFGDYMVGSPISLGYINDEKTAYAYGKAIGVETKKCGYGLICNPLLDRTNENRPCGGVLRSIHPDKERSFLLAKAMCRGMQDAGILTCAKHYPSATGLPVDSHMAEGESYVDHDTLINDSLYAYDKLNKLGLLDAVMPGHRRLVNIDNDYPTTLSKKVMGVLRDELGFDGLAVTDALGMMGVVARFGLEEPRWRCIEAGNDVALGFGFHQKECYDSLMNAYKRGDLSIEAIDRAVKRVIAAQNKLLKKPKYTSITPEEYALVKSINKNSIATFCDEGLTANIPTDKHYLFALLTEKAVDLNTPVANDSMSVNWFEPERIAKRIKENFPNSDVIPILQFPVPGDIKELCQAEPNYDDVIFVTFFENRPYVGAEHFTSRITSLMEAWQLRKKIIAIVHYGNPFLLEETPHIPRIINACKSLDCTLYAIDVLAGKYTPQGKIPYKLNLK